MLQDDSGAQDRSQFGSGGTESQSPKSRKHSLSPQMEVKETAEQLGEEG